MYESLKPRQKQILNYIYDFFRENGYPPSVREICKATGLRSTATVHNYLLQLEEKGYIHRDPQKPRAIEILDEKVFNRGTIEVPLVGRVTAGQPILAQENIEETYLFPKDMLPDADIFMLSIVGDSMVEAGILDGDYVIVKVTNTAENGDIVVALVNSNEATIKKIYKERNHIRLQPANRFMEPIILKDAQILGKVVGLYRKL